MDERRCCGVGTGGIGGCHEGGCQEWRACTALQVVETTSHGKCRGAAEGEHGDGHGGCGITTFAMDLGSELGHALSL